tara:strand:- start:15 stop:452 length:438 start_codon:yes stop_codon:yes gene_type:complete
MNNTSIKTFYYNMKTIFYKIATDKTTIEELCYIVDMDRSSVIQLLSVLNNRMDIAFSGLNRYINISLLQDDIVAMTSYPTSYIGKYVKINNKNDIDILFENIMDDNYYADKLNLGDSRPLWYYSHQYNIKKDEFSDDILKEFNFK